MTFMVLLVCPNFVPSEYEMLLSVSMTSFKLNCILISIYITLFCDTKDETDIQIPAKLTFKKIFNIRYPIFPLESAYLYRAPAPLAYSRVGPGVDNRVLETAFRIQEPSRISIHCQGLDVII